MFQYIFFITVVCRKYASPLGHKHPLPFQRKVLQRYFYPAHKPPSPRRKLIPQVRLSLFKPLSCLLLRLASSPPNAEARQPAPSFGSMHLSASHSTLGPHTPTNNVVMLYSNRWHWKGEYNHRRKCCIPRISPRCALY